MTSGGGRVLAGVDGCKAGWIAVHREPDAPPSVTVFPTFAALLDALLATRKDLRDRIFESHPEVAFCRLNGGVAMTLPKKIKGAVNPAGMDERRALLCRHGYEKAFLDQPPPKGAASDDFLDAAAMMLIAGRIASGEARPSPDPPLTDRFGIPVAIWA